MSELKIRDTRQVKQSLTVGAAVLLGLMLFGMVNYLGGKYYKRFDWTSNELYSLSEKSINVVRSLDRQVEAVVLMSPGDPLYAPVQELLSRYAAESSYFSTRAVEPEKNLVETRQLVEKFGLSQLNVVVFDRGDDQRVVSGDDLAEMDFSGVQFGEAPKMAGFKGEQAMTSTLIDLMEASKPKIVFTSGHGERGLDDFSPEGLSQAQGVLSDENFDIEEWASLGRPAVPDGTDLVVVAGPAAGFIEPELAALRSYLDSGGRLLMFLDPAFSQSGGLQSLGLGEFLQGYGVELGNDIVIDPANPLPFFGAETIFVNSYGVHPITRSLDQTQLPVILPLARSVGKVEGFEGYEVTELLKTSPEGWGETDLVNLTGVEQQEGDLAGPVSVALAVTGDVADAEDVEVVEDVADLADLGDEQTAGDAAGGPEDAPLEGDSATKAKSMRLVVIGDSDFASNGQLANVGNIELFSNAVNWLAERDTLVGIPPKRPEQVRLNLTGSQLRNLSLLVFAVLPGMAVLLGTVVFFRRRR